MQERRARDRAVRRGVFLNTDGWQMRSPTGSRRLRDSTAASFGLLDEVLFNAEKRRSGDLEGENGERRGVIYSADFIKCGLWNGAKELIFM